MTHIKYGQIGVGHAHAAKISAFRQSDEFEVVGVAEPDAVLRRQAEQSPAYRGLKWMSQEQLLNEPGLQVVGVETHVRDLLDTAQQCVAAGKHIHLDKPAGDSLPQFKRILDDAARQHLVVQMGYMYRYNPAVVLLRQLLNKGWLGEPFEVHTVMSKRVDAAARGRLAEFAGGSMFELGCHIIDLVVGALGPPDQVHAFPRHSAAADDQLNDNMLAVFEYGGATATVRSSVNEVEGFARRHFALCGSRGTMHIQPLDRPRAQLALLGQHDGYRQGYQDVEFPQYVRYVDDVADLARLVRHEKDTDFPYDHDYAVQKAVLQACGMTTT